MEVFEKSQTVDPEVRAYIYSLVNAVGGQSTLDDRYSIGDDALAVLNDLLRWLRLYDEKTNRFDVKRCLAEANLVKGDLLEILALWPEEQQENKLKAKLALACLQLLVPLTWPIEWKDEQTTVNHLRHTPYLRLAQVGYKRTVLQYEDADVLRTVIRVGLPSMAQPRRERSRRDEGIIRMVLYFLRNMAMISQPQDLPSQGDENDVSRSSTIEAFLSQDVFNLLLTVASSANDEFQDQDVILLEILFHLVKGVDPKKLFLQQSQLANQETSELQHLILKEKAMLNSYKKHAPTRHNRFGTMLWVKRDNEKVSTVSGQNTITNDSTTLIQMDKSKKWDRPRQRGKKVTDNLTESGEFGGRIDLTDKARKSLSTFVEDFLDSGFNPLFSSLRKTIRSETDRLGEPHRRQYFYLISWFLSAEAARREQNRTRPATDAGENTYAYIAAVLDQDTFVLLNIHMQRSFDEKIWRDLQATLLCFTQILLTVQNMAESDDEEDQEIAENIQNRIFYEESTHDRILQILRGYNNQGFAYLDAVTDCVHVFVRMLERYSKENVDLQIRSKRRARRKKKQQEQRDDGGTAQPNDDDENNDDQDEFEAQLVASERKFDFARFSAKFCTQPCVNTFVSLLHYYADLSPEQLKRCHRYLYRLAFKNEMFVLLFRVDILALIHKMIKGPDGLPSKAEGFKEWEQLVQQIFRKCIKWIERESEGQGWREAAVVEMLFSKIPASMFYLQNGFEHVVEKKAPRPPAELQIKASVAQDERLGVVVSAMLELGKGEDIGWFKDELRQAAEERQAWEDERAARPRTQRQGEDGEDGDIPGGNISAPAIYLHSSTEERQTALFKDKYLRLLLTTAGLERLGAAEDLDAAWILPSELSAADVREVLKKIEKTEFDPPTFDEGQTARDLIRTKGSVREKATHLDTDSGSDRDIDENQFPPNLREKRKHSADDDDEAGSKKKRRLTRRNGTELTEAEAQAKAEERRQKERERNNKIKSQLFVTASDDESDEEGDAEFFRLEEERRKKMNGFIRTALRKEAGKTKKQSKKRKGKKKDAAEEASSMGDSPESEMDLDMGGLDSGAESIARSPTRVEISSDDESASGADSDEEETPSTSPFASDGAGRDLPLTEVSGNATTLIRSAPGTGKLTDVLMDDNEDEEPVVRPTARRNVRAGFIIESDSE